MKAATPVILYTRSGCHLCEIAEAILISQGTAYRPVDIEAEVGLEEKYGLLIPVVRIPESGRMAGRCNGRSRRHRL